MTELPTNSTSNGDAPFEVAVIGAGLVGLNVCLGLLRRNIPVTVYEQATELKEIGAGLGLSSTLEDVLAAIDPAARDAVRRVGIRSPTPGWINGMSQEDHSLRTFDKVYDFEIEEGNDESFYCQRAQLLDELVRCVPAGTIHLKKRVERIVQNDQTGKVSIEFTDGEKTEASAVIGCDGVKSHVRQAIVADSGRPTGTSHYAHESAYRFLVSMDKVLPIWGDIAKRPIIWTGKNAHMGSYPIANNTQLNVACFLRDKKEWPTPNRHVIEASKTEMIDAFSEFSPALRVLLKIAPDQHSCWGLFDTFDEPLLTYATGSVVLAGDSAHASTPHHGLGAAMGVEDALFLVALLDEVASHRHAGGKTSTPKAIREAFQVYDQVRRPRTQEVVAFSRRQGQLVKGEVLAVDDDHSKFKADITARLSKMHAYDCAKEVNAAVGILQDRLRK